MVELSSERRVGVVTDGMGGIGSGIVVALTKRGFDIVVCDLQIDQAAAETLRARTAPGSRLSFVSGDLADLADHPRFVDAIFDAFGQQFKSMAACISTTTNTCRGIGSNPGYYKSNSSK
jgi:NAD(P)-dependent dehydrogenase (short-subunit alcohol dehydrogenase family)